MTLRPLLLAALAALTISCAPEPAAEEEETPAAPAADLSAFERRRAQSDGAQLEQKVMDQRAAGARKVYASTEDEPTLIDLEISGELPEGMGGGEEDGNTAGTAAPTDLDKANEEIGPWIDMDLVGRTIRSSHRSLKTCHEQHASGGDGRVDVRLTVNGRGQATDARIARSSPTTGNALERCLSGVLKKAKFPEARNGDKSFSYVLRF